MVDRAAELLRRLRAFHKRQRATHRRVYRVGSTGFFVTAGQATATAATAWAGTSLATAGLPSWAFFGMLVGGFFGGKYLFPVPDDSVASGKAPQLRRLTPQELEAMSPQEIRTYENNMMLAWHVRDVDSVGARYALQRQRDESRSVARDYSVLPASLEAMPLTGLRTFRAAAARHGLLKSRWLSYELDAQKQLDYPAMTDVSFPPTAAMIKAMRAAEAARASGDAVEYANAVETFSLALASAEAAAGVPSP